LLEEVLDAPPAHRLEILWQVVPDAANPGIILVHPSARHQLDQVEEQLPLPQGPEQAREQAQVRAVRGEPHEVGRDALEFEGHDADPLAALRGLDPHHLLDREAVRVGPGDRGDVAQPIRQDDVLLELSDLHDLLVSTVEVADLRLRVGDRLPVDFDLHVPEAMGHGMLRSHVDPELRHHFPPRSLRRVIYWRSTSWAKSFRRGWNLKSSGNRIRSARPITRSTSRSRTIFASLSFEPKATWSCARTSFSGPGTDRPVIDGEAVTTALISG